MEGASDKLTIFFGCDFALAANADAAGVPNDFTNHVLGRMSGGGVQIPNVRFPTTNRPFRDVVRPDVRSHARGGLAITEIRKNMIQNGII